MNWPSQHERDRPECHTGEFGAALKLMLVGLITLTVTPGCNSGSSTGTTVKAKPPIAKPSKIVAEGQILPAGGLIRLAATPGDIVDRVDVGVGDYVTAGQPLIIMRSLKLHEARVEALQRRFEDAKQQQASAIEQARLRLTATENKLAQIAAQAKALNRQEEILKLAEKQVTGSEKALERLNSIATDPLTSNFVGTLQIDQQRMAVNEAQLKYRQQVESFQQAKEAVEFGVVAAEQESKAAKLALQTAQSSLAVAAIEAEMKALEFQQPSAIVTAPQAAVVVAINTRVGEAAAQFPLIELADVTKVICEAEVVETDAALISPAQTVRITSPALPQELHGRVLRRGQLVGRPQLAVADPLAKADYRSVTVTIEIEPSDVPIASKWLQLQVSVEIELAADNSSDQPASTAIAPQP